MKTVAICDTEPVAAEGLRALLQGAGEWRVVAMESQPADLLDAIRDLRPALAVFDRAFGLHPLLASLESLGGSRSGTAPVVWGVSISEPDALRLLRAGAMGVVRKTSDLTTLLECLKTAASGGIWVDWGLVASPEVPPQAAPRSLTGRELQILELVERSFRNKDIAAQLGIQVGTVKIHLRHIFEKTGIRGRYGLALSGLRAKRLAATLM